MRKKCSTTIPSQRQWSPWSGPWGTCWRHRRSPDKLAEWSLVHSPLSVPWCMQMDCSHPPIKKNILNANNHLTYMCKQGDEHGPEHFFDLLFKCSRWRLPLILQLVNILAAQVLFPTESSLKVHFPPQGIWILVFHMHPCNLLWILLFPFSTWCCRQAAHLYLCKKKRRTILCYGVANGQKKC